MRCAVLGDPVAHSLSPAMHRAAYDHLGLRDWRYEAVPVPAGGLAAFVAGLDDGWRGLSVTMPLKREALALATSSTERARAVGGANTLVLVGGAVSTGSTTGGGGSTTGGGGSTTGSGVHADNTDLPGAVAAIRERYAGPVTAGTVLGGGATAASLGFALADLGAQRLRLLVRDADRAAPTLALLRDHPARPEVEVADLASAAVLGEVVASTVPASAQDADLAQRCAAAPVLFEALYDPWPTPLAAAALAPAGDQVLVSGLDLLLHQAALQVQTFTGLPGPLAPMREAATAALAERSADLGGRAPAPGGRARRDRDA